MPGGDDTTILLNTSIISTICDQARSLNKSVKIKDQLTLNHQIDITAYLVRSNGSSQILSTDQLTVMPVGSVLVTG